MKKSETNPSLAPSTLEQASHLFAAHQQTIYKSTDRMFAVLMSVQWLAGVIAALLIAPRTWIGTSSQTHIHVWAAVFLGGAISFFPIVLAIAKPGAISTRYVIATAQMLMSALLIYLTGGRIETHFHVFGSLAFLAFYRDWRVLVPATIVVAADHFLRGIFWPQSVYGVLSASEWRWLEHAGWVLFEDTFLFIAIKRSVGEMWGIAQRTAELNDNEERYRAVVEQTAEGLVLADVDTMRVLECNVAFADLLGYTVKEALKLTAYDFIVDEREAIDRRSGTLLDRRLPITGERRFRRKDGSIIDVDVNVTVIFYGGKDVFCTVARDIGERKRAEEALRESELRLRKAHEELETRVLERTTELAAANDDLQSEVAERKLAEEALRNSEEHLLQAQKMESIGTLAGGVAHDFNNLLTAVQGHAELALRQTPDDLPVRDRLVEIGKAAARGGKLTQQLLAFSRRQRLERKTINLNDTIADLTKMLQRLLGEDVEVQLLLAPNLSPAFADSAQIEQVVMNLAINGRDAMPRGGRLIIETHNTVLDERYCRDHAYAKPGKHVLIKVSDTGVGMDAETRARIFEPFFTTKEVGKGTGLGLAMVYGIVKQHEGLIEVYSEVDQGTSFGIYLPADEKVPIAEKAASETALRGGAEVILVAEDEETLRYLARDILSDLGYRVILAKDGEEAVELYERSSEEIDLLLFDVVMPRVGGYEAYTRIRSLSSNGDIPLIFMTGYSSEMIETSLTKDIAPIIQKPYTVTLLGQTVREVLDSHSYN